MTHPCSTVPSTGHRRADQPTTLARLQLAAQCLSNMGRPSTGIKTAAAAGYGKQYKHGVHSSNSSRGSSNRNQVVDTAAVDVLQAVTSTDTAAPARCPASLLLDISGVYAALTWLCVAVG